MLTRSQRFSEAEALLRKALAIQDQIQTQSETSHVLHELAQVMWHTGRPAEADEFAQRALAIDENLLGATHPRIAERLNGAALALRMLKRDNEAEALLRRALAIAEAHPRVHNPNHAIVLNNLAMLLRDSSRLNEAATLSYRAVELTVTCATENGYGPRGSIHIFDTYADILKKLGCSSRQVRARLNEFRLTSLGGIGLGDALAFISQKEKAKNYKPWWKFW